MGCTLLHKGAIAPCNLKKFKGGKYQRKCQYWLKCTLHRKELECFVGFFSKKPGWLAVTCNATNKPRLIQPAAHSSAVCWLEGRRRIHCLLSSLGYTQDQITSDLWGGCMISIWYLKFLFRLNTLQLQKTAVKSYVTKRLKDLSWHIMLLENVKTQKNSPCSYSAVKSNHNACSKVTYSICCTQYFAHSDRNTCPLFLHKVLNWERMLFCTFNRCNPQCT